MIFPDPVPVPADRACARHVRPRAVSCTLTPRRGWTEPDSNGRPHMSNKRKMRRNRAQDRSLEVVYGPMPQPWHARLSKEARDALPHLRDLIHDDPHTAVTELRAWIAREPNPMFFNWLGAAYGELEDGAAVKETVRENFQRYPLYLFARLNYAELCLRDGDLPGAREALGSSLDLRAAVGGRRRVHVSEVAGYYYAVGLYHFKAGDLDAAESAYDLLAELAPDERGTEALRRMLHPRLRDLFVR
jgi:tetratricopeptide (TPR) repeat protein